MWKPTKIQWGFGGWASEQAGIVRTNICSQYTLYIMYVINQYERSTGSLNIIYEVTMWVVLI